MEDQKAKKAAYYKTWYQKNRESVIAKQKERSKENYKANPQAYKERSARWKAANPERLKELQKAHSLKNAEKIRIRSKDWYANNKQTAAVNARRVKLKMYGLTIDQYQSLLESQNHCCAICEKKEALTGKLNRMYVDHCHLSGKARGLLCQKCNAGLGMFGDRPDLLAKAITYLSKWSSGAT